MKESPVQIPAAKVVIEGDFNTPENARGIVLFAHGSGSSRFSPRNRFVAEVLRNAGLATLLVDLLTEEEEADDALSGRYRFNIRLLAERLVSATDWLKQGTETQQLTIGYFGASTGAGAALPLVKAPTLLIVGGHDYPVIELNQDALARLRVEKELVVILGATHLFEEPGALDRVAQLAAKWFVKYLARGGKVEQQA